MGIASLAGPFLLTWFCIHAFLFLLQRFLNRPNLPVPGGSDTYELLPTSSSGNPSSGVSKVATPPSHGMLVKPFHVRFTTTGLNGFFYKWGSHPRLSRFWRVAYDLGVLFALLAMVAGWALLIYAAIGLISTTASQLLDLWVWFTSSTADDHSSTPSGGTLAAGLLQGLRKRALEDSPNQASVEPAQGQNGQSAEDPNMVLVPVIPGVTLPLSHLPYYLLALFISGIVHEAGHAFAAARERTQISSSGIFLYILYPGAFVDVPSRAMSILTPIQQLRIICAGVWHNIVLFLLAWLLLSSQMLQFSYRVLGWQPLDDAVTVAEVSKSSPLYGHLAVGSIITQVDDTSLKGNPLNIWKQMLLDPESINSREDDRGFCVPEKMLNAYPHDCCAFTPENPFGHSRDKSLSCFTPFRKVSSQDDLDPDPDRILVNQGQCLPSYDILADRNAKRCTLSASPGNGGSSADCPSFHRCYRPFHANTTATMIRLYCQPSPWITDKKVGCNHQVDPAYATAEDDDAEDDEEDYDEESDGNDSTLARNPSRIVLYQGDPRDIWDGVQVTNMKTRWSFLPLGLPNATMLTLQYIMSFSLALSILNIVPARHLDGHHALKSLWHLGRMMSYSYKNSGSIAQTVQECLMVDVATAADEDKDSTSASGVTTMGGGATGTSSSNSAAIAASLSLSTAVSSSSKKAPILIKGIVVTSSVLLGGVMFGSLLQMVIQLYI